MSKGLSCPPQIFIMLQYQTLPHRVKATVLRADNLDNLVSTSAAAGKTTGWHHLFRQNVNLF